MNRATATALDAADGRIDGRIGSRPIPPGAYGRPPPGGFTPGSNAAALDAADGVMDGRINGRPIVQSYGGRPVSPMGQRRYQTTNLPPAALKYTGGIYTTNYDRGMPTSCAFSVTSSPGY